MVIVCRHVEKQFDVNAENKGYIKTSDGEDYPENERRLCWTNKAPKWFALVQFQFPTKSITLYLIMVQIYRTSLGL